MERRRFLQLVVGFAAALSAGTQAAPLSPHPLVADQIQPPANRNIHSAVTTEAEVEHLKPEEVRWGHHWHHRWHWRRRHRGWHRRWHRWHRRHGW